jgi:hypothetical protein
MALVLAVVALGCGGITFHHASRKDLPLVPGARVLAAFDDAPVDYGASHDYLLTLIVLGPRGLTSPAFKQQQFERLLAAGWRRSAPHFAIELAAVRPESKLSATVATLHDAQADAGYVPDELARAARAARASGRPALVVGLLPTS